MNRIGKLNSSIYRNFQILLAENLKDMNMGTGQYDLFYLIARTPGMSQNELSMKLNINKSTTAKSVKILEDKEYIIRKKDKKDGRIQRLYISESGEKLIPKVNKIFDNTMKLSVKGLTDKDLDDFERIMEIILKNLLEENNR